MDEDAVDRVSVVARKLIFQPPKKGCLLWVEGFVGRGFMIEVVSVHHSDAAMTTTVDSFNRIGAHEFRNIASNCHFGDTELMSQIVVCIVPSQAQHFQ